MKNILILYHVVNKVTSQMERVNACQSFAAVIIFLPCSLRSESLFKVKVNFLIYDTSVCPGSVLL